MMTDAEINRILRGKQPSHSPRRKRKAKLKMRYGASLGALTREMLRTAEKLALLTELAAEYRTRNS